MFDTSLQDILRHYVAWYFIVELYVTTTDQFYPNVIIFDAQFI